MGNCLKQQKLLVNTNLIYEDQQGFFSVCCDFLSFFFISFIFFSYLFINVYFHGQSCKMNLKLLLCVTDLENINTSVIWWQKSGCLFLKLVPSVYSLIDVPLLLFIYSFSYLFVYLVIYRFRRKI